MGLFKRAKGPKVHDPMVILDEGGSLPPVGDMLDVGGNIVPVTLAQQDIPDNSLELAGMALDYLGKPRTDLNMAEAVRVANTMLGTVARSTLEGYAKDSAAFQAASDSIVNEGYLSITQVRSAANLAPRGAYLWDYNVIKVYSLMTQPGGVLSQL